MRVKKPTSKRVSTRLREGIKKKAAAQNRKNRKIAKKDVTWKSRVNKDPGIPANFPYKDRIINELETQRRLEQEKKEAMKAERKAAREAAAARGEEVEEMEVEEDDGNALSALLESAQNAAKEYDGEDSDAMDDDEEEETVYDVSIDPNSKDNSRKAYDKIFKTVVEASDVVLYVMDARDPESTRSKKVEEAVLQHPNKRLILVLNKVDLVPDNVLSQWLDFLKSSFPTVPVKANGGASGAGIYNKQLSSTATASTLLQALKAYAAKSNLKRSIIVGVIGYPNVGKSSIINSLTNRHGNHSKGCPVGNQAGVTTSMREIKIDGKLKILDSPGIVFPDENKNGKDAKLALLSAIPPKSMGDPTPAVQLLLKRFSQDEAMAEGLKQHYQLPPLPQSDFEEFTKHFLIHVARTKGRLGKGGVPNLEAAAILVLNDWRDGRILGWTLPKSRRGEGAEVRKTEEPRVERTEIVTEWAKEFDLDGLI